MRNEDSLTAVIQEMVDLDGSQPRDGRCSLTEAHCRPSNRSLPSMSYWLAFKLPELKVAQPHGKGRISIYQYLQASSHTAHRLSSGAGGLPEASFFFPRM